MTLLTEKNVLTKQCEYFCHWKFYPTIFYGIQNITDAYFIYIDF